MVEQIDCQIAMERMFDRFAIQTQYGQFFRMDMVPNLDKSGWEYIDHSIYPVLYLYTDQQYGFPRPLHTEMHTLSQK